MPEYREGQVVETPVEARGAVRGHNVWVVLTLSMLAVIVLFAAAYWL